MGILKKAQVNINNLNEQEKECFNNHYNNNENIYILATINNKKANIEYKITSLKNNIYNLEFTGKAFI